MSEIMNTVAQFLGGHIWYTVIIALFIGYILKPSKKNNTEQTKKEEKNTDISELENKILSLEKNKLKLEEKLKNAESNFKQITDNQTPETEIYIKEINKLKEELEYLEEELEDEEKKNKKLRVEKTEVEEELENVEKEKKYLVEEKESLEKSLEIIEKKAKEDKKSLLFINNILNAQNSSNNNFEKLDNDTNEICFFIKNKIANYFQEPDIINNYAWEWRNSELKFWIKNKKKIAIVGEFSAGKTSIINRILSQDNPNVSLLPVSSKETTAIPTYIYTNEIDETDFNCNFFSPDNELRNINKETFEMVTKSVLDKVNVSHLIKYFVLSYNNQYLNNISILDTPGFASNSDEIIKKTTDVVREADALFWVIDANTGDINQTSIEVMKNHLSDIPLYFIINKSDTKSPGELNQLEKKIKKTAIENNIQYKAVIQFSQKENVDVLMKYIQEIEIQEQEPLIKHIANTLEAIIKKLKEDKKETLIRRESNLEDLQLTESNFTIIQEDIIFSAEKIKKLVKDKKTWGGLGKNKFEIERLDYNDFQDNVSTIVNLSGQIKQQVEFHSEEINTKIEIDTTLEEKKHELKEVEQIKKDFIKLITDYNPTLLK